MDRSAFAREVAALTVRKRLPDGIYAHVDALPHLPAALRAAVDTARALAKIDGDAFHVIKFALRAWKLSLLAYPGFFEDPFPSLAASWAVDLGARSVTSRAYAAEGNPPILAALTAEAERLGLLAEASTIGLRRPWEARSGGSRHRAARIRRRARRCRSFSSTRRSSPENSDARMHASIGDSAGPSFDRSSAFHSSTSPRRRSHRRIRFSTRAATAATALVDGARPRGTSPGCPLPRACRRRRSQSHAGARRG
jgi:hypothetical protein